METLKFKTSIKCSGCVAGVTPYLDKAVGAKNWQVDINSSDKLLTIASESGANEEHVIEAIRKAGYTAEKIS